MRRKYLPVFAGLLALGSLAGCADMVRTVTYEHPQSSEVARGDLKDAGATGQVLLVVRDNPFAGDVARSLAAAASETSIGFKTSFTTDRTQAAKPDFRVVVQFSPAPGVSSVEVCDPSRPVAKAASGDGLTALIAFCNRSQPILSVVAYAGKVEGPDSPVIKRMAEQAMIRMFIPSGQSRDGIGDFWPDI